MKVTCHGLNGAWPAPTEILIKVRQHYLGAVEDHFGRHPVSLDSPATTGPGPGVGSRAAGPFGDAELVIFPEMPHPPPFVPPALDPATMIGRDVDDAERELTAVGWQVRPIADGDPITLDLCEDRANLRYRSRDTPPDRVVYETFVG